MDKKRKKAKLKLGKNKLVILEDSIDFDPKSHCLIACNAGQKCGVDQKFLKSAPLLATSSESEILQPKNETFAVILVDQIDPEFLTKPVVFELPKNQQNPTIYFFLSPIQTFKKFEKLAKFPSGLELVENFVTDLQAQQIINFVNLRLVEIEENPDNFKSHHYNFLKNRSVLHFQHNFDYDVNGSTTDISQDYPMPEFLSKILTTQPDIFDLAKFDQLTINKYHATEGSIPPHTDNTEAFDETIVAISLNADTVMEFNSIKLNENYSIHLPANSLLKMSGPSRYDFTHAIVARKSDYIQGQQVFRTQPRISLTFRKTKYLIPKVKLSKNLEISNVKNVYDTIAEDFSRTRWNLWPKVVEFIDALPEKITVADLGCGNGKYLNKLAEKHRQVIATDFSKNLLEVARNKDGHSQVVHNFCTADITYLPFRDELCEAAISIAVIHHLTDYARRRKSVEEILRILKPGGLGLITVWCRDQKDAVYADKEENQEEPENCLAADDTQNADDFLQVHKSRTTFKTNDMLVPWKLNGKTYHRYYHLFEDGEFEKLCHGLNCRVLQVVIDNGNYCCYIQKS